MDFNGYINWPSWIPENEDASVEYSSYNVILPSNMKFRYRLNNINQKPTFSGIDKKSVSYKWEIESLKPFKKEPYRPLILDQFISVITAPSKFKLDNYEGDLNSWKSFGKWYWDLSLNRQSLPLEVKEEILSLAANISDRKEKIKRIYQYLQSKTRYVNIKIGIGGWQPISAEKVHECGYGDYKALTNYMIALLNCADIKAYPSLIYNSYIPRRTLPDFPCNQFNHVIVCVPCGSDTVWLECTSQTQPFAQIGSENQNRYTLLILDEEGKLIKTPSSFPHDNIQARTATVSLQTNGNGSASVATKYTGSQQEEIRYIFSEIDDDRIEHWLKDNIEIPSFRIKSKSFQNLDKSNPTSVLNLDLELPHYTSVSSNRIFFNPNLMERRTYVPDEIDSRKYALMFPYPYCDVDTIIYKIPAGYNLEAGSDSIKIETDFSTFQSSFVFTDSVTIQYYRLFEIKSAEIPPEKYEEYRDFLKQVVQSDKNNIVLVKN